MQVRNIRTCRDHRFRPQFFPCAFVFVLIGHRVHVPVGFLFILPDNFLSPEHWINCEICQQTQCPPHLFPSLERKPSPMGLLSFGTPLAWTDAKDLADHVRSHGISQFLYTWDRVKDRCGDELFWGDEVLTHGIDRHSYVLIVS